MRELLRPMVLPLLSFIASELLSLSSTFTSENNFKLMSGCLVTLLPGSLWCSRAKAERRKREREGGGGNKAGRRSGGSRQEAAARPNTEEMRRRGGGSENQEGALHIRRLPLNLFFNTFPILCKQFHAQHLTNSFFHHPLSKNKTVRGHHMHKLRGRSLSLS